MNTQTHIVYSNRAEHDFWESGMLVPLVGALCVGVLVFLALVKLAERVARGVRGPSNFAMGTAFVFALLSGALVFNWLLI